MLCGVCVRADDTTLTATNTTPAASGTSLNGMAGKLGAGIVVGEPIGPSLKYFFSDSLAIDGALGWSAHDHTD